MSAETRGKSALTTRDKHALDLAVRSLLRGKDWIGFGTYHVGTSLTGEYRDVDVRSILADDEFDAIFGTRPDLWSLLCYLIADHLTRVTGLPIDYQIQRQTEANEKHKGPRSALGITHDYAARGDATRFTVEES